MSDYRAIGAVDKALDDASSKLQDGDFVHDRQPIQTWKAHNTTLNCLRSSGSPYEVGGAFRNTLLFGFFLAALGDDSLSPR